jgi:hypothetical protein
MLTTWVDALVDYIDRELGTLPFALAGCRRPHRALASRYLALDRAQRRCQGRSPAGEGPARPPAQVVDDVLAADVPAQRIHRGRPA